MAGFLCWNPYWVLCAVNYIMFPCLESPAGCRLSVAAGGWAAAPNPSSALVLFVWLPVVFSLTFGWVSAGRPQKGWQTRCCCRGPSCSVSSHLSLHRLPLLSPFSLLLWLPPALAAQFELSQLPESNTFTSCTLKILPFILSALPVHSRSRNKSSHRWRFHDSLRQLRCSLLSLLVAHSLPSFPPSCTRREDVVFRWVTEWTI